MKHHKSLKTIAIMMIIVSQLFLIGARWLGISLRNVDADNPLVKIDSLIGGSSMPDSSKIPNTEQNQSEKDNSKATDPILSTEIKVRVRGKNIFINDTMTPESSFEVRFMEQYDESKQVILIDDFADYQTYTNLLSFFNDKSISIKEEKYQ